MDAAPMDDRKKFCLADFTLGDTLGEGAYAKVVEAKLKSTGALFALKIVDKQHVLRHNKHQAVVNEKNILSTLQHPGCITLIGTFQDAHYLYFILELAPGGELFRQIKMLGSCPEDLARFYSAEVVAILAYLRSVHVMHRDLKPENLLLSADGHIRLTDFGSAKILIDQSPESKGMKSSERRNSFVGTAEYVSPELLNNQHTDYGVDCWSLGCVLYQLLCGHPPFQAATEYLTFQLILNRSFTFPDFISSPARSLIDGLLCVNQSERLGCGPRGLLDIMEHPFFIGIDFSEIFSSCPPSVAPSVNCIANIAPAENIPNSCVEPSPDWSRFILAHERVVFEGLINKRKGIFARRRYLILTSAPRFVYINPTGMVLKGEIPWTSKLTMEKCSSSAFYIHTPSRTYYMQAVSCSSQDWIDAVKKLQEASCIS